MSNKKNDIYTQSEYFSNNSSESSPHEDNIDCFVSNKKNSKRNDIHIFTCESDTFSTFSKSNKNLYFLKGDIGERGPKGDKGERGDKGPRGPEGKRGHHGKTGSKGSRGHPGISFKWKGPWE